MSLITNYEVTEVFKNALVNGALYDDLKVQKNGNMRIVWDNVSLRCKGNKIYLKFRFKDYAFIDAEIDAIDICDGGEVTVDFSETEVKLE